MMVEDNVSSGDVENQSQPAATTDTTSTTNPYSKNYTHKKWKVIALASFLLVAVILAITLPLTIGSNNSNNSTDSSNGSSNSDGGTSGDDSSNTQDGASSTDNYLGASSPTVQVYKSQFLDSNGPIKAQVRIMDPSVAGKSALVLFYECVPCKS